LLVKRTADPSASLPRHAGAGGMTKGRVVERQRTVVKGKGGWGTFSSSTALSVDRNRFFPRLH
jgi:hypothetical protein